LANGNEFLPNYVEYLVPLQEPKKILPRKLTVLSLAFVLVFTVLFLAFFVLNMFAGLVPVALILVAFVIWYLWRFVSVEYEYTVTQGELSFDVIYGRRQRKKYYSVPIRRIERIVFLEKNPDFPAQNATDAREIFAACRIKNSRTACALIREENAEKTLLYFEIPEKAEKVLRFYNAKAFFGN